MIIPLEFYNHLRQQIKPSEVIKQKVPLSRKGNEYLGLCPFHAEKTPSFTVNDVKGFYHCFGCGAHGDIVKFVSDTLGLSYKEAAIKIAQENGIELPKMTANQKKEYEESERIYDILELASSYFVDNLSDEAKSYLLRRGLEESTLKKFSIGYTTAYKGRLIEYFEKKSIPLKDLLISGLVGRREDGKIYEIFTNRIMFPIRNIYNKVIGFGGRVINDGLPKYINSPETLVFKKNDTMYGENIATSAAYKKNYSIIVEGYMDVVALNQAGINEVVASLGTAVSEKHLQKLWRSSDEIIVCLDNDAAGQRASHRLIDMALPMITAVKKLSFINLATYKDPDEFIKAEGSSVFQKLIEEREDLSKKIWQRESKENNFTSAETQAKLEKTLEDYCNQIKDKTLAHNFRRYFKDQMWQQSFFYKKTATQNFTKKTNKTYLSKDKDKIYTETEVIERSLCSFMIKFPNILQNSDIKEFMINLTLSDENLNEFKEWFINLSDKEGILDENKIAEYVKTTRFYKNFSLLSNPNEAFLDLAFVNKNQTNHELIFNLLSKKLYLLSLKQEYIAVLSNPKEDFQLKASFYLKEIQETSKKVSELNEFFIN